MDIFDQPRKDDAAWVKQAKRLARAEKKRLKELEHSDEPPQVPASCAQQEHIDQADVGPKDNANAQAVKTASDPFWDSLSAETHTAIKYWFNEPLLGLCFALDPEDHPTQKTKSLRRLQDLILNAQAHPYERAAAVYALASRVVEDVSGYAGYEDFKEGFEAAHAFGSFKGSWMLSWIYARRLLGVTLYVDSGAEAMIYFQKDLKVNSRGPISDSIVVSQVWTEAMVRALRAMREEPQWFIDDHRNNPTQTPNGSQSSELAAIWRMALSLVSFPVLAPAPASRLPPEELNLPYFKALWRIKGVLPIVSEVIELAQQLLESAAFDRLDESQTAGYSFGLLREGYVNLLRRQREVAFSHLAAFEKDPRSWVSMALSNHSSTRGTGNDDDQEGVYVLKQPIEMSTAADTNEALAKYERQLSRPLALKKFDSLDMLSRVRDCLLEEFPWATDAVKAVMAEMFARSAHGSRSAGMSPVLLVGPPGCGKTRFANRLSERLGIPNMLLNMAGMSDTHLLKGVSRGWASNQASRFVDFMGTQGVANPLFILDEIDKTGAPYGNAGDPKNALLDLLERNNAKRYYDVFLLTEVDLSNCLFIGTANSVIPIEGPLLSRFRQVNFPRPSKRADFEMILVGLVRDLECEWGLPHGAIDVPAQARDVLLKLPPRKMRQMLVEVLSSLSATPKVLQ